MEHWIYIGFIVELYGDDGILGYIGGYMGEMDKKMETSSRNPTWFDETLHRSCEGVHSQAGGLPTGTKGFRVEGGYSMA